MLILTRRVGETLQIGNDISVTVVEVNGNQVRIGIAAPKDVAIMRDDAKNDNPPPLQLDSMRANHAAPHPA